MTWDERHYRSVMSYMRTTRSLYTHNINKIADIYQSYAGSKNANFTLDSHPTLKKRVDNEIKKLAHNLQVNVVNGVSGEWGAANLKNDSLVKLVFGKKDIPPGIKAGIMSRNMEGLAGFKKRTINGMGLSDRVWKAVQSHRTDIELAMALGIKNGTSAHDLALEMQQHLNEPDKLFRKVMTDGGPLMSKAAENYHPGPGVYRSSYKNALRMTRTEINGSYRMSDHMRWEKMEFVLGYEVRRSQNIKADCSLCDALQGRYPKDYIFTGWHPQCMCYQIPVLPSDEEFDKYLDNEWEGKPTEFNYLKDNPEIKGGLQTGPWNTKSQIQKNMYEGMAKKMDTEALYSDGKGNWTPERKAVHDKIMAKFETDLNNSSNTGLSYFLGGAPANGKSTLINSGRLPHPKNIVLVDPDKLKTLLPEYNLMANSREPIMKKIAGRMVHEESSYLSKLIQERSMALKRDIVLDGVNDGPFKKVIEKINAYRKIGGKVRGDYVTLDAQLSEKLAIDRAAKTGREVPIDFIRAMNHDVSVLVPKLISGDYIDELFLWDTNINGNPRLIMSFTGGKIKIFDKKLWQDFLDKAK